jgi:hypothetical protein
MQELKTSSNGAPASYMRQARMAKRYRLREVVTFSCGSENRMVPQMTGVTEEVSTSGISFITGADVEIGSNITLDLYLRSASRETRSIQLHAEGIVLRVESNGTGGGNKVAASVCFREEPDEGFLESNAVQ